MGLFDMFKRKKTFFEKVKDVIAPEKTFMEKLGDGVASVAKGALKGVQDAGKEINEAQEKFEKEDDRTLLRRWKNKPSKMSEQMALFKVLKDRGYPSDKLQAFQKGFINLTEADRE